MRATGFAKNVTMFLCSFGGYVSDKICDDLLEYQLSMGGKILHLRLSSKKGKRLQKLLHVMRHNYLKYQKP